MHRAFRLAVPFAAAAAVAISAVARAAQSTAEQLNRVVNQCDELLAEGRLEEAMALGEQLVPQAEAVYGPDGVELVSYLNSIASIYRANRRDDDALVLYRRCLGILDRHGRGSGAARATVLENYADLLHARGKAEEAKALYAEASAAWVGPSQPPPPPQRQSVKDFKTTIFVEEYAKGLTERIAEELSELTGRGYEVRVQFYEVTWTKVGGAYEARFRKLAPAVTGEPVLYEVVRHVNGVTSFGTIALDFGRHQDAVNKALTALDVGGVATVTVAF